NGTVWSIPVTLAVSADDATRCPEGRAIALRDADGSVLATMDVTEQFSYDKTREARSVFRTEDSAHPGVARLYAQGDVLLAGPITLLNRPEEPFSAFRRD